MTQEMQRGQIEVTADRDDTATEIRRGLSWNVPSGKRGLELARKVVAGTITAQEIIRALEPLGVWWGIESQYGGLDQYEAHAEGYDWSVSAKQMLKEYDEEMARIRTMDRDVVPRDFLSRPYPEKTEAERLEAWQRQYDYEHEKLGGSEEEYWSGCSVPVIFTAKRPKWRDGTPWDPAVHNPSSGMDGNSYLPDRQPLEITEVRYSPDYKTYRVLKANGIRTTAAKPSLRFRYDDLGDGGRGRVVAWWKHREPRNDTERQYGIGMISWNPEGKVSWVQVYEDWNLRQGVATALWEEAKKYRPDLHHSEEQSESGRAWARTTSTKVAGVAGLHIEVTGPDWLDDFEVVATIDGKVVGRLRGGKFNAVDKIYVDPAYRRRGIATAMWEALKAKAGDMPLRDPDEFSGSGAAWFSAVGPDRRGYSSTWGSEPDWSGWMRTGGKVDSPMIRTAAGPMSLKEIYSRTDRIRDHVSKITHLQANDLLQKVLTDARFPSGDLAYTMPSTTRATSYIGWTLDETNSRPPTPIVYLHSRSMTQLVLLHEAAHLLWLGGFRGRNHGFDTDQVHDQRWFEIWTDLVHRYADWSTNYEFDRTFGIVKDPEWEKNAPLVMRAAKTAGPMDDYIPLRFRSPRPPSYDQLDDPRPVLIDRPALEDIEDLPGDIRARLKPALEELQSGRAELDAKERDLDGVFTLRLTPKWRAAVYLGADGNWHLFWVGPHNYDEVTKRWTHTAAGPMSLKVAGRNGDLPEGLTYAVHKHYHPTGRFTPGKTWITAKDSSGGGVGMLSFWNHGELLGEIYSVDVAAPYRRRGVATELLRRAREIEPKVHHSENLSDDGRAWSQKVASLPTGVTIEEEWDLPNLYAHERVVSAFLNGRRIGWLVWQADNGDGRVNVVVVEPEHRRKGIATALWNAAKALDPNLKHDPEHQTDLGKQWAPTVASVGQRLALPSWRDRGVLPAVDCVIAPDLGRSSRNSYLVYIYDQPHARRPTLAEAKATVEEIYGPLDWQRIEGDQDPHYDRVHGWTTMFNDAPYYLVVERLPRLGATAAKAVASVTSSSRTIYRGLRVPFTDEIKACFKEYEEREETVERRSYKVGPLLLEALEKHAGRHSNGVGIHWSTRPEMAAVAAETSGEFRDFPVILEATYTDADVVPEGDDLYDLSAVWQGNKIEAEVLIKPGARLQITGVWITRGSWNSQVTSVDKCPRMKVRGDEYANVLAQPQRRTAVNMAYYAIDWAWQEHLDRQAGGPGQHDLTKKRTLPLLDRLARQVLADHGHTSTDVEIYRQRAGESEADYNYDLDSAILFLDDDMRNKWTLLHEMAHVLDLIEGSDEGVIFDDHGYHFKRRFEGLLQRYAGISADLSARPAGAARRTSAYTPFRPPAGVKVLTGGDAVPGGYNGYFAAFDETTGEKMGYLDYQSAGDDVKIAMVEVEPKYQRQGVATLLLDALRHDFPDARIDSGYLTVDGDAWWSRVRGRVATANLRFEHLRDHAADDIGRYSPRPGIDTLVAYDGPRVVGHISWHTEPGWTFGGVDALGVDETYQRRGIATELLRRAKAIEPAVDPHNTPWFTDDGAAWVRSLSSRSAAMQTLSSNDDVESPLWKGPGIYEMDISRWSSTRCVALLTLFPGLGVFPVGWLTWDTQRHTIEGIFVNKRYRGKGIAVEMKAQAEKAAGYRLDNDSGEYTREGLEWAKKRGIPAKNTNPVSDSDMARMQVQMNNLLTGSDDLIVRLLLQVG